VGAEPSQPWSSLLCGVEAIFTLSFRNQYPRFSLRPMYKSINRLPSRAPTGLGMRPASTCCILFSAKGIVNLEDGKSVCRFSRGLTKTVTALKIAFIHQCDMKEHASRQEEKLWFLNVFFLDLLRFFNILPNFPLPNLLFRQSLRSIHQRKNSQKQEKRR
jgi:hypothetical protein